MKFVKLFCVLASAFLLFIACSNQSTTSNNKLDAVPPRNSVTAGTPAATPVSAATGKDLYTKNCANCHKEDGTGGKVTIEGRTINPDNLTSDKIKGFSDEKITGYVTNGIEDEGMPSFKDKLTREEINTVVAYLRSDIQKMPAK